jgi:hypothetical protein
VIGLGRSLRLGWSDPSAATIGRVTIVARPSWWMWVVPLVGLSAVGAWRWHDQAARRHAAELAVTQGVAHVATLAYPDWIDLVLADVVRRRFDVAALAPIEPALASEIATQGAPDARVLLRIATPDAVVTRAELDALTGTVDPFTGPALHCDRIPLPAGYARTLESNVRPGEYQLTHVVLAMIWIEDNHCARPYSDDLRARVIAETAKLVHAGDGETTDLELEAAALLSYLGEERRLPPSFIDDVVAAQRPNGGWAIASPYRDTNGHTTGFALWFLCESLWPGRTEPMVARAR